MKALIATALLAGAALAAPTIAQQAAPNAKPAPSPSPTVVVQPVDRNVLHVQVILDSIGFGPGILDGKGGQSLQAALKGFQEAKGLPRTGKADAATLHALYPYRAKRPTARFTLTREALAGPYYNPLPKDYAEQAKLPSLGYATPMEKLAEMFHTQPAVLIALNSPDTRLKVGNTIIVPNALPASREYDAKLPDHWRQTLAMLNVDANQPVGDHVVVDKSDKVLRVLDKDDHLIAQFSATMGSEHDPLPLGQWTIKGADYNPTYHYNPALFWDAKKDDKKQLLPAGPNSPVGVVWLDLSKEHYGIHGTPHPELIGRTESHGCIRLTNWDVARLAQIVKPGTKALFQA